MCQIAVERPFDRLWSSQMLKVASLSAQALRHLLAYRTGSLRRLMCNSLKQGRSRDLMLTPYLDQKAVLPHGSGLLPRLIVRPHGGLVEVHPLPGQSQSRASVADLRLGDPRPRHPRPVVPLQKREGLLSVRLLSPSRVLSHPPVPEP